MDWGTKHDNHKRNVLTNFLYQLGVIDWKQWRKSFHET